MRTTRVSVLILVTVAALLALTLAGCGDGGEGGTSGGGGTGGGSGRTYSFDQPIGFEGGTFTFTKADSYTQVDKVFEDNQFHTPVNGAYVTVYYTFQGNASNEAAGVDGAIFQLRDSAGRAWTMDAATSNGPASDLARIMKLAIPGMQTWNDPDPESTVVMLDVPVDAYDFTINLVQAGSDGKVVTEATVPLGF